MERPTRLTRTGLSRHAIDHWRHASTHSFVASGSQDSVLTVHRRRNTKLVIMSVYRSQSSLQRISRACAFRSFPVRYFRATARPRAQDPPAFSAGSDTSQLTSILNTLLSPTGRWSLSEGGRGVERGFKFKSFKAAWVRNGY